MNRYTTRSGVRTRDGRRGLVAKAPAWTPAAVAAPAALAAAALVALAAGPAPLAAQEGGGNALFAVNPGLIVWTLLVFGLLVFILGRFAWGPMLGALEAREHGIQGAIDRANQLKTESEQLMEQHRAQLAEARREAQQIVAESREAAQRVRREIEEKARAEGEAILTRARRDIEREKNAAIEALRREAVELALSAASKLIDEHLDTEKDRDLVLGYVRDLGAEGGAKA